MRQPKKKGGLLALPFSMSGEGSTRHVRTPPVEPKIAADIPVAVWIAATLTALHPPANAIAEITLIAARPAHSSSAAFCGTRPAHCHASHRPDAQPCPERGRRRRNPG